jgi:hypothetical protein
MAGVSFDRLELHVHANDVPAFLQELGSVIAAARSNFKVLLSGLGRILFTQVAPAPSLCFLIECLEALARSDGELSSGSSNLAMQHLLLELVPEQLAPEVAQACKRQSVQLFLDMCTPGTAKIAAKLASVRRAPAGHVAWPAACGLACGELRLWPALGARAARPMARPAAACGACATSARSRRLTARPGPGLPASPEPPGLATTPAGAGRPRALTPAARRPAAAAQALLIRAEDLPSLDAAGRFVQELLQQGTAGSNATAAVRLLLHFRLEAYVEKQQLLAGLLADSQESLAEKLAGAWDKEYQVCGLAGWLAADVRAVCASCVLQRRCLCCAASVCPRRLAP